MSLKWDFNHKIGELLILQDDKAFTINVYQGNALAIFTHEFTNDEGKEQYSMYNFFLDKEHFRRRAKSYNYSEEWVKLTLWEVPNDLWLLLKDLQKRGIEIQLLKKAPPKLVPMPGTEGDWGKKHRGGEE